MKRALLACLTTLISISAQTNNGVIAGYVLDPLGNPIPACKVWVTGTGHVSTTPSRATGITDPSGYYVIRGLPTDKGPQVIRATARGLHVGYAHQMPSASPVPTMVDVQLWAAADIHGTIRGMAGKPLAGVEVTASTDSARKIHYYEYSRAVSDEAGHYKLAKVILGEVNLRASAANHLLSERNIYHTKSGRIDIVMKEGRGRSLRLTANGVPSEYKPPIHVRLFGYKKKSLHVLPLRLTRGALDASRTWAVQGLPEEYNFGSISLNAKGLVFDPPAREFQAGAVEQEFVYHVRQRGHQEKSGRALRGRLLSSTGQAIAHQNLSINSRDRLNKHLRTEEDGRFSIAVDNAIGDRLSIHLEDSDWHLAQEPTSPRTHGRFLTRWITTFEPSHELTLRAKRGHSISGILRSSEGVPLRGIAVKLESDERGSRRKITPVAHDITDEYGKFRFGGLPRLDRRLWLTADHRLGNLDLGPYEGTEDRNLDIKLNAPAFVAGRVTDQSGKPLPGTRVTLHRWDTKTAESRNVTVIEKLADLNGRYRFSVVASGHYYLDAQRLGFVTIDTSERFEVKAGGKITVNLRSTTK